MNFNKFITDYKINFQRLLHESNFDNEIIKSINLFNRFKRNKKKILIFGNGASASISNHVSVDLTKNAKCKTVNFNESNLITCLQMIV